MSLFVRVVITDGGLVDVAAFWCVAGGHRWWMTAVRSFRCVEGRLWWASCEENLGLIVDFVVVVAESVAVVTRLWVVVVCSRSRRTTGSRHGICRFRSRRWNRRSRVKSRMLSCLVVAIFFAARVLGASAALPSMVCHCIRRGAAADCFCRGAVLDNLRAMTHRSVLLCGLSIKKECLSQGARSISKRRRPRETLKVTRGFGVTQREIASNVMFR